MTGQERHQSEQGRKEGAQDDKEDKNHSSCSSWGDQKQQLYQKQQLVAPDVRCQI
jgi:hypothetical protein